MLSITKTNSASLLVIETSCQFKSSNLRPLADEISDSPAPKFIRTCKRKKETLLKYGNDVMTKNLFWITETLKYKLRI